MYINHTFFNYSVFLFLSFRRSLLLCLSTKCLFRQHRELGCWPPAQQQEENILKTRLESSNSLDNCTCGTTKSFRCWVVNAYFVHVTKNTLRFFQYWADVVKNWEGGTENEMLNLRLCQKLLAFCLSLQFITFWLRRRGLNIWERRQCGDRGWDVCTSYLSFFSTCYFFFSTPKVNNLQQDLQFFS